MFQVFAIFENRKKEKRKSKRQNLRVEPNVWIKMFTIWRGLIGWLSNL